MDWWLFSCVATGVLGLAIGLVLLAFRLADRSDRKAARILRDLADEAERVIRHGDQHPWMER